MCRKGCCVFSPARPAGTCALLHGLTPQFWPADAVKSIHTPVTQAFNRLDGSEPHKAAPALHYLALPCIAGPGLDLENPSHVAKVLPFPRLTRLQLNDNPVVQRLATTQRNIAGPEVCFA